MEIKGIHPAASFIPEMTEDEQRELQKDIEENGQQVPILVTPDGFIIDGRHRHNACRSVGIETKVQVFEGDNILETICSLNLHRRNLTSSQRAAIAVKLMSAIEKTARDNLKLSQGRGKKGPKPLATRDALGMASVMASELTDKVTQHSRDVAAKLAGTNPHYVSDARAIQKTAPDLFKEIEDGDINISQAKKKIIQESSKDAGRHFKEALDNRGIHQRQADTELPFPAEWAKDVTERLIWVRGGLNTELEDKDFQAILNEHGDHKRKFVWQARKLISELQAAIEKLE